MPIPSGTTHQFMAESFGQDQVHAAPERSVLSERDLARWAVRRNRNDVMVDAEAQLDRASEICQTAISELRQV